MLGPLRGCVERLAHRLGGCCRHRAPSPPAPSAGRRTPTGDDVDGPTDPTAQRAGLPGEGPPHDEPQPGAALGVTLGPGAEVPPGPWRWRWVWPTPGRPAGMALVAADGTLVLWSPGGFATPGEPDDGRPTPDLAEALARLPELAGAAADADELRRQLDQARRVADETRDLLSRAVGAVDDEIGRAGGTPAP